jgi:hypothetical protein
MGIGDSLRNNITASPSTTSKISNDFSQNHAPNCLQMTVQIHHAALCGHNLAEAIAASLGPATERSRPTQKTKKAIRTQDVIDSIRSFRKSAPFWPRFPFKYARSALSPAQTRAV